MRTRKLSKIKPSNIKLRLTGEVRLLQYSAECICRSLPAKYLAETSSGSIYLCEVRMQNAKVRAQLPELVPYKGRRNPADAMIRRISGSAFSAKRR